MEAAGASLGEAEPSSSQSEDEDEDEDEDEAKEGWGVHEGGGTVTASGRQ